MKPCRLSNFLLALLFLLTGTLGAFAQNTLTVLGEVKDEATGEPLIGVSVTEIGQKQNGTATDIDGKFTLKVAEGSSLKFSYVGYTPLERKAAPLMSIRMKEDSEMLEEVVVVGYGVQKKSDLTGSVSSIKNADIQNRALTNVNEAIGGKTAGVQTYAASGRPGAEPNLQVRGIGSNGSSAPLFVVDGRVATNAQGIDPNNIESIEILKDGASAAIYGAAAGNGVILITTRKGSGNGKVTYDMQLASQSIARKPKVMNSEQFIDYFLEQGGLTMTTVYNNWDFKTNTDWMDVTFKSSFFQKHNLSFEGGNEKGRYFLSGTYLYNNGMVVGDSDVQRNYSGMVNGSYKIFPWLEVGTNNVIDYAQLKTISEGGQNDNIIASAIQFSPLTAPTYTIDNMPAAMKAFLEHPETYGELLSDGKGNYYGLSTYLNSNRTNPLILRDRTTNDTRNLSINGTAYLNLTPFKGFRFTSRFSYAFSSIETYAANHDYFANYSSGAYQNYIGVNAGTSHSNYWQWENFANYNHKWGEHDFTAMLGQSYSETRTFGVSGAMSGNMNGDKGWSKDDPLFLYWAYANPSASKTLLGGEPNYLRKNAYFGRLNYNYADKYLVQFSLRADAADSSVLPIDQRWGYFPAGSLGWVISNEKFMESTSRWLNHLKLRASWGQNGSLASLGGYMYAMSIKKFGDYQFGNDVTYTPGYAPTTLSNDKLKWETSEQFDIGIDFRMFNSRLQVSADYYDKRTKDLIVSGAKLSNITGYPAPPINAGSIENRGFEIEATWADHIGNVAYSVTGNITTLKNKVTKVHDTVDGIDGVKLGTAALTRFEKGQPAWYFYGYKYEGVNPETGDAIYADIDGSGDISEGDRTYIGKGIPDLTYGITLTAMYKGFDLIVFGNGTHGSQIFNVYDNTTQYVLNKLTHFTENRWTDQNHAGTMPRATEDMAKFQTSSAAVFSGDYFKIKQIQLGYTLPDKIMKKLHLSKLRVYASLENFFTFTDYPGFDPEIVGVGQGAGIDWGMYPSSKKVLFGLNLQF